MIIFVCEMVRNIVGKGENACNQHFLLSYNVFKSLFFMVVKRWDCWIWA